ncbi:hypothetical protein [Amycolatopsis samaneae]|uniref:Transcriptional regulator n=1 Tax=Amycolatopsis samaneae TaxID=664691 RepID=A0ABW5GQ07_9PSEU
MKRLAGTCNSDDDCPMVSLTAQGTIAVQGNLLDLRARHGEAVVEIPLALLLEAANAAQTR